jgi:regulatory protein
MTRGPYEYALDLLAARAYTVRNLRRKLVQKEFAADEVDRAIARLVESGLLDDRKYAAGYARQKIVVGGSSVRRVRQELAKKGIDAESVGESIDALLEEEPVDQEAAIERMAVKKLRSMGDLDGVVKRRRVFGYLARKGYEIDDINRVLARISLLLQ